MATYRKQKTSTPFGAKSGTPDKSGMFFDETGTKKFAFLPWLIGKYEDMFGKDSGEWSREQEKIFLDAVKRADQNEMVEKKMSLLNPDIDDMDSGDEEGKQMAQWKELEGEPPSSKTIWELYEDATPQEDIAGYNELDLIAEQNLNQRQADTEADALVQSFKGSVYDTDTPDMVTKDSSTSKKIDPATAVQAAGLLNKMLNPEDEPIPQMQSAGVRMGKIPYPSLLATTQRQPDPRYINKGLL